MMQFLGFLIFGIFMIVLIESLMIKKLFSQSLMFMMSLMLMIGGIDTMYFKMISMSMGIDEYSYSLMILVGWILGLMVMSLNNEFKMEKLIYLILLLMLNMIILFLSMNLMMFYLFFEVSLIPMILIIVMWGYSIDRFKSMLYMYFYTLFFSLPLMMYLLYILNNLNLLNYSILKMMMFYSDLSIYMILMMMTPFLVKIPMYMLHGWLPKAHVEAPLIGSMFLAGILLKLGGYGLIRMMMMFENLMEKIFMFLMIFSLIGSMMLSIQCLNQVDMKVLVAYSSVVHMGLVLSSMMSMKIYSFKGGMMMMVAHGLCSSAMFYLVNLSYKLTGSRSMLLNKGMINYDSSMSMLWFLICMCNMSIPMSLNLLGELYLIIGILSFSKIMIFKIMIILFFSACYTLYLYTYSQYGQMKYEWLKKFNNNKLMDFLNLIIHWLPLMLMFMNLMYMF